MENDFNLATIDAWRSALGLMPVPLFSSEICGQRFVLLNGNRGNFCLDLEEAQMHEKGRSYAWSSNVGHYVVVGKSYVEVQRWDQRQSALERYNPTSVLQNLEDFHAYLENDIPKQGISIVAHVIGVFRRLRSALQNKYSGTQCLKIFLYLLACTENESAKRKIIVSDWDLDNDAENLSSSVRNEDWRALREDLIRGRTSEDLIPDLTLLLRHASGQLFQEAHYEAIFGQGQLSFGGLLPTSLKFDRKQQGAGVHFTPSALARTLVETVLLERSEKSQNLTIFDPACGSGEFLTEVLRQLDISGYDGQLKLIGWDISEAATEMARFVLAWEKRNTKLNIDYQINCVDSLDQNWPSGVDIILMNPPFVSWQDMDEVMRKTLLTALGQLGTKRPDLCYAFLLKAESCLKTGGILGTVIPASFLDGSSSVQLRQRLAETMSPTLIARLGNHLMFEGAIIAPALYVARKDVSANNPVIAFWADHRSSSNSTGLRSLRKSRIMYSANYPILGDGFSIYKSPDLGRSQNSWAPRPYATLTLLNRMGHLPKVQDLFEVKQGVRSGYNKAFQLQKDEWLILPIDEQKYFRPAVVNDSIRGGCLFDTMYVFYPYGNLRIGTQDELEECVNTYYRKKLLPSKQKLISRTKINQDKWWELTRHRRWQTKGEVKLVSTSFGGSGSFAWDDGGNYVVCQGYAWLPKNRKVLSVNSFLVYLALLNSRLFSDLLSATSNSVGGGQWDMSAKYVDQIAIPDLFDLDMHSQVVVTLCDIGCEIHSKGMAKIDRELLEDMVMELYNIGIE